MNTNQTHRLGCDDKPLAPGVKLERHWSCTCGRKFYGYDNTVKAAFKTHKEEVKP